MKSITQVSQVMQKVLVTVGDEAGRRSGFIRRERKLRGSSFVQMLVFGWMFNPGASLEGLSQAGMSCGAEISS